MEEEEEATKKNYLYPLPEDSYSEAMVVREGLPAWTINSVIDEMGFGKEQVADFLDVSSKTLDRYIEEHKTLNPMKSELILKILTLYRKGLEIFGDSVSFKRWLDKPSHGLGGKKPVEFLNTSGGIELVRDNLLRIEFGDLA